MKDDINPKFPYRIERAHWYLIFLLLEDIITEEEFDRAIRRLNEKTGQNWCV